MKKILRKAQKMQRAKGLKIMPFGLLPRLAQQYGVKPRTIAHIIAGNRWGWVK